MQRDNNSEETKIGKKKKKRNTNRALEDEIEIEEAEIDWNSLS